MNVVHRLKMQLGMKNKLLSIINEVTTLFNFAKQGMPSQNELSKAVVIPVEVSIKHPQIMNKGIKNTGNHFGYQSKTLLFVITALLMAVSSLKAQIINEGFEEPIWQNFGTGPGASTYGSVVLANVPANSIMSYLTSSTSFTMAPNTCNNSGTWFFSKATSQSSSKYGAGAHSISHSVKISGGGYIITPMTPAAVVNITFWASNSSGSMVAGLATDPAAASPGYNTSTTAAPGAYTYATSSYPNGTNTMQSYSFGGTFSGPCRFGIFNPGGTIYVDDIMVFAPTGNPPTVATNTVTPAITNAQVNATVTVGATPALPLLASGIIWSTSPLSGVIADTLQPKTRDIPASTSSYTDVAGPLTPNTTYYTEAYVIGLDGSVYFGASLKFTTNNTSAPTVVTNTPTSVLSYSAIVGGSIPDSGGCIIIKKGVCYGLTANPTVAGSKTIDGIYGTTYTSSLSPLSPNQTYHYRAYAYNSCYPGIVSYGGDSTFTTGAAVPSLVAIPSSINFGNKYINSTPIALSYILKGFNLTANGTITVSAPAGYTLSTNSSGPFTLQTITFGYTGTAFSKPIYVQLSTANFGVFSGNITHSGGGAVAPNVDAEFVTGTIIQSPNVLSNVGTEFWAGFGCEENMKQATTQFDTASGSANGAHFSLYIAAGSKAANVVVDLPGLPGSLTFPRTITVPANSVVEVGGFPIGDGNATNPSMAPDVRLYTTGVSGRGIHVTSTNGVPVSCWLYDWATNNSAGGAMLFPTNTWNSSYTVQAYGGTTSNTGTPNSFFFVITNDDNTVLTITPTADIIDSISSSIITKAAGGTVLHAKGVPYTVTLPHKGDVYNAMGLVDASSKVGYDLTGTKVSTDCSKKIAVFGGNARSLINTASCSGNTSGSDNLVQQMFPKVAWGKNYLTVPTKNMEFNMYRISVDDPTTVVKLSGVVISPTLWNATGSFYEYGTNKSVEISADKPISVTQFIMPGTSCGGASAGYVGTGDPEMILLSPTEQAITNTTVFCPGFKDGSSGGTYINVIIPTSGVSSFSIDGKTGAQMVDTGTSSYATAYGVANCPLNKAFKVHPADANYSWAKFHVSYPAPHTLSSTTAFNAIAYGESQGESWGYNAGTSVKNLTKIDTCLGPCHLNGGIVTCVNNPLTLQVALAFQPSDVDSIVWYTGTNIFVSPFNTSSTGAIDPVTHHAQYVGTIVQNGETFYVYSCPIPYTFTAAGIYDITATAMGKFASDCPGVSTNHVYVTVGNDVPAFTAVPVGCGSKDVTFTDASSAISGSSIVKWDWNFGDGTPNSTITNIANPNPSPNPHTYPSLIKYTAILTTTNSYGCVATDSVSVNLAFSLTSGFTKDRDTMCPGSTVTFTDTSSTNATVWNWHFGEPSSGPNDSSHLQNPTHLYTDSGRHIISLQVFSAAGCPGNIFYDTIYVSPKPKADFVLPLGVCLPGNTVFTNATNPVYGTCTYFWNFGGTGTDTATNPIHQFPNVAPPAGGYPVKLVATSAFGCVSDTTVKNVSNVFTKPTADFTLAKSDICLGDKAGFLDNNNSTAPNQTINQWHWFFGDGRDTITTTNATPHIYSTLGTDSVKLVIQTDKGCVSDTSIAHAIKINPLPTAAFIVPGSCLTGGSVTFTDQSTVTPDDGTNQPFTYSWSFGSTTKDGTNIYTTTGTYQISQTVTTAHGCSNTITQPFVIAGSKPRPYFYVNHKDSLCSGFAVTITDTSRIDIGTIGRVDVQWDANDPAVTVTNPGNGKPGTSTNYTHTYVGAGTHYIKLIAYAGTSTGCSDSVITITPITVYPQPTAAFVVPGSCLSSGSVTFTDASSITPDDGTNKPFTYFWVYDPNTSGATGTTQNGIYKYIKVGLYNVSQTVTSQHGCTNTITQQFDVAGSQPRPAFYVNPASLCSNVPVVLTDTSRIDIGVIKKVEIYWDYTPGMTSPDVTDNSPSIGAANSSKNYTYSYPVLGADKVYTIRLVAYSGATCFHDTTISVTVHGSPKVFFSALPDICLNATPLTITQASELNGLPGTFTYLGPTGTISGNTFDPSKLLPYVANTYNIQAVYTTTAGCVDTSALNAIRVLGLPKAYPVVSNSLCEKRAITFNDTSNAMGGIITSETWVINGNTYSGSPVTVSYPGAVNDIVKLIVKTSIGCASDTARLPVIINPLPNVDFTIQASTCLPKGTTLFTDLTTLPGSVQPVLNHLYNFGDSWATPPNPNISVLQNPTHDFTHITDYNVTLKVTSSAGCDSSLTKILYGTQIHPAPVASFTTNPSPAQVCLGQGILFTDNSAGPIKKSIFYYGDGNIDTTVMENHFYTTATSYTAMHAIIDNNNCISVNNPKVPVLIDPIPSVYAGVDKYVVVGDSVVLNEVIVNANNFTSWWSASSGIQYLNDPTILNPVFTAGVAGTFTYTLNVKSKAGCTATDDINLIALDPPIIPNVFSPNGDKQHDTWDITYLNKFPGATVKVFNRYGQLIYNVIGYAVPWDGKVNGGDLPVGTYYYIISPKNGLKDIVGSITIIR